MKLKMLSFSLIVFSCGYSQKAITLTFNSHAIKSQSDNVMKTCNYVSPGMSGANVNWDFSGLQLVDDFTGRITNTFNTVNSSAFPLANIELEEYNNKFYFRVDNNRIEQYGFRSGDNNLIVKFDKPCVKMTFPFTYGNELTGNFTGLIFAGLDTGILSGTYKVTSDGYGTLVLPGKITINNTLRIKYEKNYSQSFNTLLQNVKIISYRWYCESYRYPLLVLTEINSGTNKIYHAAFNAIPGIPVIKDTEITINSSEDALQNLLSNKLENSLIIIEE